MICSWCGRAVDYFEHVYVLPLPDLGHTIHVVGCFYEFLQDRYGKEPVWPEELGGEA
jgi:hypothetical protein